MAVSNAVNVVGDFSHEYAHVIQVLKNLGLEIRGAVSEGHARGVQRTIAKAFAEQYDNPAYNYRPSEHTLQDLKDAYLFTCKKKHRNPKKSLTKLNLPNKRSMLSILLGKPAVDHDYSMGVAAFCIVEARHGTGIYSEVLRNDYFAFK